MSNDIYYDNFFGGFIIEMMCHIPLIILLKSKIYFLELIGYLLSMGAIGVFFIMIACVWDKDFQKTKLRLMTLVGIVVSFFVNRRLYA